jgi:hypothetical protein
MNEHLQCHNEWILLHQPIPRKTGL